MSYNQKKEYKNKIFYNAKNFEQAYLTDFLNYLVDNNIEINCVKIRSKWMEIDTVEDLEEVEEWLSGETITQWLEEELRLVLNAIISVYKRREK